MRNDSGMDFAVTPQVACEEELSFHIQRRFWLATSFSI